MGIEAKKEGLMRIAGSMILLIGILIALVLEIIMTIKFLSFYSIATYIIILIWFIVVILKKFEKTYISFEPIMDFDIDKMIGYIKVAEPNFVSIGADSKGHKLPEPSSEKVKELISELKKFTKLYE